MVLMGCHYIQGYGTNGLSLHKVMVLMVVITHKVMVLMGCHYTQGYGTNGLSLHTRLWY